MAIFKCDSCGYERDVPDKLLGKKAKCPDCGYGVTIVDELPPDEEPFEDLEEVSVAKGVLDDESVGEQSALDLDGSDIVVDLTDSDDIVCAKCGQVLDEGAKSCPACGEEVVLPEDLPELTEDHVDISDLADEESPQIWDEGFATEDGDSASLDEDEEASAGWNFFEGNLALNIFSGLVSGLLGFFFAIAMALLASAPQGLHEYLPYILSTSLTGMTIGCVFFALQSRIPFAMSGPGTVMTAILFLILGDMMVDMVGIYSPDVVVTTLVATVVISALSAGLILWCVGRLGAGEHISYIPLQIIGGVIGAIGLYIIIAALDWIGPLTLDWSNIILAVTEAIPQMDTMHTLMYMGPPVVFGLILFIGLSRYKNSLFMLGLLLVASAVGHVAWIWGPEKIIQSLAAPIPHLEGGVPLFAVELLRNGFGNIQWGVISSYSLNIGMLSALIVLTTMYRVVKLELLYGQEADLSTEYRALGITNMLSGLCGGMPCAISYGRSAGNYASGGRGPVSGLIAGLVCGVGLFFVDDIITLIPSFVPEGMLIFAGLSLVRSWMFKAKSAFTGSDDLWMLWLTFMLSIALGVLVGVGFGVSLALLVTVARNSKGGAIRNILSGANHRSNVDRAPAQQRTLKEFGDHIHILRLQGFLFLGSMGSLLKNLQQRFNERNMLPVEYLILDFKMVTGLASAAGIGFDKLRKLTEEHSVQVIITSAPLELEEHLEASGHLGDEEGAFKVFFNLDFAMEWCENHVLDSENMLEMKRMALPELLAPVFPEPKYIPALMKVLKRVDVKKGEAVFRQGDDSDSMFFVESGRLDVELELEGGKLLRLKKVGPGAVFGEMGIYTLAPRSATVRAAEKCVLYMMTTEKLEAVEKRAPMLVTTIHRFMINMLSDRLGDANVKVRDLMM